MNSPTTTANPIGFQKAQRIVKKARIGLCGVAGSGKTLSALKIALGIGKRIALVDSENNSSVLYADRIDFDVLNIEPPFEIEKYIRAIHQAEAAGYEVLILDSISHAWAGEGGLLDTQGKMADGGMNSFTAWRKLTPQHNAFIEAMIRSKLHLIATMRSKMDYVVEVNDKGKSVPKKVGLAPVQREGMDYEFDIVFDLDLNHNALSTKDRSSLFDGKLVSRPDENIGKQILEWLERGQQPTHTVSVAAPARTPLFSESGSLTGEKEAAAMLDAIQNATSVERLNSIEQSRLKGVNLRKITTEQAVCVRKAIVERRLQLEQRHQEAA
jgi:hypothetical protein